MDDNELRILASELEVASDSNAAQSRLAKGVPGDGMPGLNLIGNRDALLQIAAKLIRAAASPNSKNDRRGKPFFLEHNQTVGAKSDYSLFAVWRIEEFEENSAVIAYRRRQAWIGDVLGLFGCLIVCCIVMSMAGAVFALLLNVIIGTPL